MKEKNSREEGENDMVGFDDGIKRVAEDGALGGGRDATVGMMVLDSGL